MSLSLCFNFFLKLLIMFSHSLVTWTTHKDNKIKHQASEVIEKKQKKFKQKPRTEQKARVQKYLDRKWSKNTKHTCYLLWICRRSHLPCPIPRSIPVGEPVTEKKIRNVNESMPREQTGTTYWKQVSKTSIENKHCKQALKTSIGTIRRVNLLRPTTFPIVSCRPCIFPVLAPDGHPRENERGQRIRL